MEAVIEADISPIHLNSFVIHNSFLILYDTLLFIEKKIHPKVESSVLSLNLSLTFEFFFCLCGIFFFTFIIIIYAIKENS